MKRITLFLFLLFGGILVAGESDLQQVRDRLHEGLFSAAESFCQDAFQRADLPEIDKVLLATELAQAYAPQLLLAAQRSAVLQRFHTLEAHWLPTPLDHAPPELALAHIIFRLQCAMTHRALGDYQRWEADAASETTQRAAYKQAQATLQDALDRLHTCQQERQALQQRVGINDNIQALEYTITMQQGIAEKSFALTALTEAERHLALQHAAKTFAELAAKNGNGSAVVQSKIEKAMCHRLCGELEACAEILKPLRTSLRALSPECRLQTEAEWIRYNIAIGNVTEMRRHYAAGDPDAKLSPDMDLARLELFLVHDPSRNIYAETTKAKQLEQAMQSFGFYWAQRAGMVMVKTGNRELLTADMLAVQAERHFQDQEFIESATLYEQAAEKADANRQAETMFRYHRLAAHAWIQALEQLPTDAPTIEYQNRLIALLRSLAVRDSSHEEALDWHLFAIDVQVQVVSLQPTLLDEYLALVKEHAEHWKDSPKLPDMYRLSVLLLERQGRREEAAALLPLLAREQLATLPPEVQRLRVRQLDSEGETQAAIDMLAALLKQKREPATVQLLAEILSRQSDAKSWEYALGYWQSLEQSVERNSERWWAAREGIFEMLLRLERREEARKSLEILRTLSPELGGAERKVRLLRLLEGN